MKSTEMELIKELIVEFENSGVHKMKAEIKDLKLELEKAPTNVTIAAPVSTPAANPVVSTSVISEVVDNKEELKGTPVKSPIVGIYYGSSSPAAKPYVEVGATVKQGQILCIVEAMKVMNEIKAPIDVTITEIFKKSEDLIEFDQVLMTIEG